MCTTSEEPTFCKLILDCENSLFAGCNNPSALVKEIQAWKQNMRNLKDEIIEISNVTASAEKELENKSLEIKKLEAETSKLRKENNKLELKTKTLEEKSKLLKQNISKNENVVTELKKKAAIFDKENFEKTEELREKHKANSYIYRFYKKHFGCNITVEPGNIAVFEYRCGFYVKLYSENFETDWSIIEIKPNIKKDLKELQRILEETGDTQGLLYQLYKAFKPFFENYVKGV